MRIFGARDISLPAPSSPELFPGSTRAVRLGCPGRRSKRRPATAAQMHAVSPQFPRCAPRTASPPQCQGRIAGALRRPRGEFCRRVAQRRLCTCGLSCSHHGPLASHSVLVRSVMSCDLELPEFVSRAPYSGLSDSRAACAEGALTARCRHRRGGGGLALASRHGCQVPCFAVLCVAHKHGLVEARDGVEALSCLEFWDCGRACAGGVVVAPHQFSSILSEGSRKEHTTTHG